MSDNISILGRKLLDRRHFLKQTTGVMGGLGLSDLMLRDAYCVNENTKNFSGKEPIRPNIDPDKPYLSRNSHFPSKAKQVLVIYCPGAVSHVDTFDYKPDLKKYHVKKPPGVPAVTFEGPTGNIAKPFWDFKPRGQSGKMTSELLPHLGSLVDDFCFIHSFKIFSQTIRGRQPSRKS